MAVEEPLTLRGDLVVVVEAACSTPQASEQHSLTTQSLSELAVLVQLAGVQVLLAATPSLQHLRQSVAEAVAKLSMARATDKLVVQVVVVDTPTESEELGQPAKVLLVETHQAAELVVAVVVLELLAHLELVDLDLTTRLLPQPHPQVIAAILPAAVTVDELASTQELLDHLEAVDSVVFRSQLTAEEPQERQTLAAVAVVPTANLTTASLVELVDRES